MQESSCVSSFDDERASARAHVLFCSTMDSALDYQVASISEDATLHDSETAALFKSLLSEQRQNAGLKRASEEDLNSSQPHAPVRKKSKDDYDVQVGPAPIQLDPLDGAGAEDWSDTLASLQASLGMYPTAPSPFEPFESDSLGIGDYGVPFDLATLPTYPSTTTTPELAPLDFERLLASAGPPPPPIPTAQAPLSPGSQRRHDLEQIQAGLSGCAPSPQVTSTTETSVDLSIDPSLYQVDQKEGHDSQRAADEASLQQTFAEFFASASAQAPVASANASAPTVISLGETAGSDLPLPPPVVSAPAFATPRPTPPLSQSARPLPQPPPPPPRAPLPNADGSTNPGPTAREAAALFHGDDDNHHPCPSTGCDRKFARKSDFLRHYRIHTNERPFRCDRAGCGKSFIQVSRVPVGDICRARADSPHPLPQRSALTVHTRVHSGEKPHVCGECQRQFSDSSSLARHRRVHAGVKPFVCEKCKQKSFSRKATLTRHENTCKGPNSRCVGCRKSWLRISEHC